MAVSGARLQPKIRATLLLLLVAADCAKTALQGENAGPGTRETSQPFGGGLETPSASAELTSNSPRPSAESISNSNSPGPCAELAKNSTEPCAELTSNSHEPSAKLTNIPEPSAELTSNSTEPFVQLAVYPPTAAQLIPSTAQTLATEKPVGSESPSALPSTEAAMGLGSSLAGATAAGGEKPVTDLKRAGLKGQVGPGSGSPGPGQENQTAPGWSGQSKSRPTEPAKAEGADQSGHDWTVPASTDRTVPARTNQSGRDRTVPAVTDRTAPDPLPKLSSSAQPSTPPVKKQNPDAFPPTPAPPAASPAPRIRLLPVGVIVALVFLLLVALVLLIIGLQYRRRRHSGSTSFGGGPGEWAGPVSLPEEQGEGQAGDGGPPAGAGDGRRPTLTTFFGKRHSRVASVAMEDMGGAKGEGPLSEPLLATEEQGGDPPPQGAGEANGKVPSIPSPPSPPPDPAANGEFPLPPPMEQEALPPV